jgi:hypothetical protein
MERCFDGNRYTKEDKIGFIGMSTLDLTKDTLYITEGVSDFLTIKSQLSSLNVLGKTKLTLNRLQVQFIKDCFKRVVMVADNDSTGIKKAWQNRDMLIKAKVDCELCIPTTKDITLDFFSGYNIKDLLLAAKKAANEMDLKHE